MTDQELADAIRERWPEATNPDALLHDIGLTIYDFVNEHPRWEPEWGEKVKHGAVDLPRWYVAPNPKLDTCLLVNHIGGVVAAIPSSLAPWKDES